MAGQNIRYAELTCTPYTNVRAGIPVEAFNEAAEDARVALLGFGLGGPEIGVPRPQFRPHFEQARALGLHSIPHAGETTGPETVWSALDDLGAERIGHGTSSVHDPALLERLAASQVPLEVCPTSNIATRVVDRLEDHPIKQMYDAGVLVTVNSDDPPMFGTTLNREYEIAAELLALDQAGIADLARNAVRASFMSPQDKRHLLAEIDGFCAAAAADQG